MAGENLQAIKNLYAAFARGDAGAVLGAFDDAIVWNEAENFPYADRNPYVGPLQVGEGVFGRIMTEWDGFTVTPQQYVDGGDTVVAFGRYTGTFKATGIPVDAQFVHVWKITSGRIVSFQQHTDTLQFSRAVHGQPA